MTFFTINHAILQYFKTAFRFLLIKMKFVYKHIAKILNNYIINK